MDPPSDGSRHQDFYGWDRWMRNVFIEQLWRSLKPEDLYLQGYAGGREAKEASYPKWCL